MTVRITGPIFDGRAKAAIGDYVEHVQREIADAALEEVRFQMEPHRKTGQYLESLGINAHGKDLSVNDGGIVYGPWLEGVSSRNDKTRFKGYAQFRKTAQKINSEAEGLAKSILDRFIRRMK